MKATTEIEGGKKLNVGGSGVRLQELLALVPLQTVRGPRDAEVHGVAVDSREVRPGFVFVALEGEKTDGHRFLAEALARGATVVVSEKPPDPKLSAGTTWVQTPDARKAAGVMAAKALGEPAKKMDLVGVTGTNGKTTTTYLLDGLLTRLAPPSAMLGTVDLEDRGQG